MKKRLLATLLAVALVCALAAPAGAFDMGKVGECNVIGYGRAAIDEKGTLWMWGHNYSGQLGNGTMENSNVPVKVLDDVAAVSCGSGHTAAIKTDGTLWMWGGNTKGQLGNGGGGYGSKSTTPVKVMDNVAAVSCGNGHTAVIKTDGTLWMWGENGHGQLGNGGVGNAGASKSPYQTIPVKVLDNVATVNCGGLCTAAIKTDGTLWMWGYNFSGELGNGSYKDSLTPVKVLDNVAAVSCGNGHTAAIKTDGTLWTWGCGENGQLGNGSTKGSTTPVKVLDKVAAVSCGDSHTAAIKTDGTLWMWGYNFSGELGNGGGGNITLKDYLDVEHIYQTVPVKVMDNVAAVSCGGSHTTAVKTDGTLWTWGSNDVGQLGNGTTEKSLVPIQITLGGGTKVKIAQPKTAYERSQRVEVDGVPVIFPSYALKTDGGETNYVKVRDFASILNGMTEKKFNVVWNGERGAIELVSGEEYVPNGSELNNPFSGDRAYEELDIVTLVDGVEVDLDTFQLKDDAGGGYTYYKLRDLGKALGITVDWSAERGIYIETK